MAEILYTLKSDGTGTHTSIVTWEADAQTAHVAGTQTVLECYKGTTITGGWQADGSLRESVNINGWTDVTATDNITIRAAADNAHGGVVGAGFSLSTVTSTPTIVIAVPHVEMFDIEANSTSAIVFDTDTGPVLANRCIFVGTATNRSTLDHSPTDAALVATYRNCLVQTNYRAAFGANNVNNRRTFENCTLVAVSGSATADLGIVWAQSATLVNTVIYGFSGDDISGVPISTTYTAISDTSASGTGVIQNITDAVFVSYAGADYNPTPTEALDGAGTDLSGTFTDDITGGTRNGWDIGAYALSTGTALTFSLSPDSGPLPTGLSVNPTTGNIEGTPTESGTFPNIIVRGSE